MDEIGFVGLGTILAPQLKNWSPGFRIALQHKDLRLALEAAANAKLPLPGTALTTLLFRVAEAQGRGDQGTQALIAALEVIAAQTEDLTE